MSFGEKLLKARSMCNMTQKDLARRVYVTCQAIERWEGDEATPSIDMVKLLAVVLNVPVVELMDLPHEPYCQCCGAPFDVENMPYGTNLDGSENTDYCRWCYENGEFAMDDMDEFIEHCVPYMTKGSGMNEDEAVSYMGALFPTLKRWSTV